MYKYNKVKYISQSQLMLGYILSLPTYTFKKISKINNITVCCFSNPYCLLKLERNCFYIIFKAN